MAVKKETFNPIELWGDLIDSKVIEESGNFQAGDSGGVGFWIEEPVDIETFHSSKEYLGIVTSWSPSLSAPQREFLESIGDFENGKSKYVLWVGKGGGKNHCACVGFLYLAYRLLCMRNPHKYFDRSPVKPMTLLNVAINSTQGLDNFFKPLTNMLRGAGPKAFAQFGFNPDKAILNKIITFPKSIQIVSGHSDSGGVEGYDVLAALLDECDSSSFTGVGPMYTTLNSSAQSRFNGKQKIMAISYSRYEASNGMIRRLHKENLTNPVAYVRKYPSWEFNPKPSYTRESLDNEFRTNPDEARTIYGSNPPEGFLDSWIKDVGRIERAMGQRQWIFDFDVPDTEYRKNSHTEFMLLDKENPIDKRGDKNWKPLDPYNLPLRVKGIPGVKYVLCGDPALGNKETGGDGYGVTLGHREKFTAENGETYTRPVIDFCFRFIGQMFKTGEVQMAAVEKLVADLTEWGYDMGVFSFDAWNSASTMQNLARDYPSAVIYKHTVNNADYSALRDSIFGEAEPTEGGKKEVNGGIEIPWHPILYTELKELRTEAGKNKKSGPDHPEDGTKDIADTVARAVNLMVNEWPVVDILFSSAEIEKRGATKTKFKNTNPKEFFFLNEETEQTAVEKNLLQSVLFGVSRFKTT